MSQHAYLDNSSEVRARVRARVAHLLITVLADELLRGSISESTHGWAARATPSHDVG